MAPSSIRRCSIFAANFEILTITLTVPRLSLLAQRWTNEIDYKRKRVAVIGSGATAATLVPAMVEGGGLGVMLRGG